eukprot:393057-Hanusia_phi.AAC.1
MESLSQCISCPPGKFCNGTALISPSGYCLEGFFCTLGSGNEMASACDPRSFYCDTPDCFNYYKGNVSRSCGGSCAPGTFCPAGTQRQEPCPPGHFCIEHTQVTGPCAAGYFCSLPEGKTATPDGNQSGFGPCPAGFYCPLGTEIPISCPRGTYSDKTKATSENDCQMCPAGHYCDELNLKFPKQCPQGYFCPSGTKYAKQDKNLCPMNTYCPAGVSTPKKCLPTTYQDEVGQSSCKTCLQGLFCP